LLLVSPIVWNRCGQSDRFMICDKDRILDANSAKPNISVYPLPIDALVIFLAACRIVENTRYEIQPRLDSCDIAGGKRYVHPQVFQRRACPSIDQDNGRSHPECRDRPDGQFHEEKTMYARLAQPGTLDGLSSTSALLGHGSVQRPLLGECPSILLRGCSALSLRVPH